MYEPLCAVASLAFSAAVSVARLACCAPRHAPCLACSLASYARSDAALAVSLTDSLAPHSLSAHAPCKCMGPSALAFSVPASAR